MKHLLKSLPALAFTYVLLCLASFTAKAGGEVYEIYLNNKLILRQAVYQSVNLQSLQLDSRNMNDQLVIYYHHCGTNGKGRSIAIKNDKGNTLKEWKFADASGANTGMTIPVKDLLQLEKNYGHSHLNLFYASDQLPKGRMLSALQLTAKNTTWRNHNDVWLVWAIAATPGSLAL
jgi:hypothetical protein